MMDKVLHNRLEALLKQDMSDDDWDHIRVLGLFILS